MSKVGQMTYVPTSRLALEFGFLVLVSTLLFFVYAGVSSAFFGASSAEAEQLPIVTAPDTSVQTMTLLRASLNSDPNPIKGGGDIVVEDGALVPQGDIDGKDSIVNLKTLNGEINVYIVREADTLSQIAEMFDVSAKTILWANSITDASKIRPGDSLVILPITGVRHVVKKGDTLKSIAKKYEGDVDDMIAYNQLSSETDIHEGDTVVVPGGIIAQPVSTKSTKASVRNGSTAVATGNGSTGYTNPLPGSIKTQGIHGYNGVDLSGVPVGTSVLAALSGEVIVAKSSGWNGGYGSYVVIKHANGTQTLYGHLSKVYVSVGQKVTTGTPIGGMGNTGRSTGPHLHFEVRGARNPF